MLNVNPARTPADQGAGKIPGVADGELGNLIGGMPSRKGGSSGPIRDDFLLLVRGDWGIGMMSLQEKSESLFGTDPPTQPLLAALW